MIHQLMVSKVNDIIIIILFKNNNKLTFSASKLMEIL